MNSSAEVLASLIVGSILGLAVGGEFPSTLAAFLGLMLLIGLVLRRIPSR